MGMPVDLSAWPAVAIQLNRRGEIEASNGRLETLVGGEVSGKPLESLLDDGPSADKWRRALFDPQACPALEMIFRSSDRAIEPRAFSLLSSGDELHLVEHPAHARLVELAGEVAATNTDLVTTQRTLVIERARLAAALKELERSNKALDEFAHAVSHDLKAPLRAIKDSGEILAACGTDEERALHANRIGELVGRMRRMIEGVFDYARAGRSHGAAQAIDTRQAILDLVEYLDPPPTIDVQVDRDLPPVVGERVPFDQVFRNLLSNAFTYRRGDGAILRVSGRIDGHFVELSVADNGPGISEAQQTRIWRLVQTSRPGEGTGIGLAVVKRLVEAQGGSVSVESSEGKGATFRVRWPGRPANDRRGADRASVD